MMNLVELEISKTQAIKIYLPCQKEDVGSFDIISVKYFREQMEYDLYVNDFAAEAIISLKNMLEEALNFKLQIQNKYLDKGIGYYHNIYYNKLWTTNDSSLTDPGEDFILWSTPTHIGIETFIYNVQNKIYIEICPIYKWNGSCSEDEDENKDEYVPFEVFLSNYKPIDIIVIDKSVAEKWFKLCCEMIEVFEANDKRYLNERKTN